MSNATNGLNIDRRFTTLHLLGGFNCDESPLRPDLLVEGGVGIKKDLCVLGIIIGNLVGIVTGNIFADTVLTEQLCVTDTVKVDTIEPFIDECITIDGNLKVTGDIIVGTNTVQIIGSTNEIQITAVGSDEQTSINNQFLEITDTVTNDLAKILATSFSVSVPTATESIMTPGKVDLLDTGTPTVQLDCATGIAVKNNLSVTLDDGDIMWNAPSTPDFTPTLCINSGTSQLELTNPAN